jgi:fermentation-respiration switch protein FrsA (DUF1100 family)
VLAAPRSTTNRTRAAVLRSRATKSVLAVFVLTAAFTAVHTVTLHVRAAAILARAAAIPGFWSRRDELPVSTDARTIASTTGPLRARLFWPSNRSTAPGIVLVHGVQCMGIDDARLIGLARSFASAGYAVLTPEIPSLAAMQLAPESVAQIRDAVEAFAREPLLAHRPVVLIGASFAGGLALRAADSPETRRHLAAVVSVGGQHDLERVIRYLAGLDGATTSRLHRPPPYPYGLEVFFRTYADRLVGPVDAPFVRDALGAFLCADSRQGSTIAAHASPDGRLVVDALIHDRRSELAPRVDRALEAVRPDMAAMSPAGHLAALRSLPVFVIHGEGDDVIPVSEADDVGAELGSGANAHVVIQRAIQHVDIRNDASGWDRLRLVHVLAKILATVS